MKDFIIYKGLYGENTYSPVFDFIHFEPLQARSKMYNWEIDEHLHTDLVQIFVITSGEGLLISERAKIEISGPGVVIIPANTLHGFTFQSNICGDVITLTESYFDNLSKNNLLIFNELAKIKYYDFSKEKENFEMILNFKIIIIKELKETQVEKQTFINSVFTSFFVCVYRLNFAQKSPDKEPDNQTLRYFQAFQKNYRVHLNEHKTVSQYADELNISTVHLNRVCQKVMQKSPIQIINNQIIMEAKKYLLNTSYSISEISYFLNFNDPAYFTRFFKKDVGVSPSDFRKVY
jgi:AraC family transcriptional regulator, transcriptional activator of pobA